MPRRRTRSGLEREHLVGLVENGRLGPGIEPDRYPANKNRQLDAAFSERLRVDIDDVVAEQLILSAPRLNVDLAGLNTKT
jgi:hypothetical protein